MGRAIWSMALGAMLSLGTVADAAGQQYHPTFRPDRLKGPPPGPANDVLVLGTTHLSGLPATFDPAWLQPLIDRLATWRPDAITTENMSGLLCDALRRYPYRYGKDTLDYCPDPTEAGRALGLDVPAAMAEAERLLLAWPASPAPAQRRRLAALFLAAGEPGSALVQWLHLPATERHAAAELPAPLVVKLERHRVSRDETTLIAAPLAARLGLERLWSVDDHSADAPIPPEQEKAYETAISRAWENPATRQRIAEGKRLTDRLGTPGAILALYRRDNSPANQMLAFRSDFGAALVEPSKERFGRGYVGYWETRNLRMVANIRDVLGQRPGTRLLAIVGASHKGYYEAYLHQMHDVRLADTAPLLR